MNNSQLIWCFKISENVILLNFIVLQRNHINIEEVRGRVSMREEYYLIKFQIIWGFEYRENVQTWEPFIQVV